MEEAEVVFEVEADVVGAVFEHGHALDAEAEGEAAVLLAVDAAVVEDVGIDHAAAENLDPAGVLAEVAAGAAADVAGDVHLGGRLREGEVGGAQADADLIAEHALGEVEQRLLHVGKRHLLGHIQALHLVEDAVGAGGDGLVAEDAARTDYADRGLLLLHGAHLQRRGVRAQQHIGVQFDEEGVLHVAGGVFLGEVEGGEHVPVVLDVGAFHGGEADVLEDAAHLAHHDGDGVHGVDTLFRCGTGDVGNQSRLAVGRRFDGGFELVIMILGEVAQLVHQLAELLAVFLRHVLDFAKQSLDFALFAQKLQAELLQILCILNLETLDFRSDLVNAFDDLDNAAERYKNAMREVGVETTKALKPGQNIQKSNSILEYYNNNSKAIKKYGAELKQLAMEAQNATTVGELDDINQRFNTLKSTISAEGLTGRSIFSEIGRGFKQIAQFVGTYGLIQQIPQTIMKMAGETIKVDSAITELRKVSDASDAELANSFTKATAAAKEYGVAISDVIASTADWKRLGYTLDEAEQLADATTLLQRVGDNMTQESASQAIISTMRGFQLETDQVGRVVDLYNEIARMIG